MIASSRRLTLLVTAVLVVLCSGCSSLTGGTDSETARVKATVKAFMQARMTRDDAKVRTFLASDFHKEYVSQPTAALIGGADPHYHRFEIIEVKQSNSGTWLAFVRIEEHAHGFAPTGWFAETVTLVPIDGVYQVANITKGPFHPNTDKTR